MLVPDYPSFATLGHAGNRRRRSENRCVWPGRNRKSRGRTLPFEDIQSLAQQDTRFALAHDVRTRWRRSRLHQDRQRCRARRRLGRDMALLI